MKKFNITWTAPANDGGAAITGHDVGYTPSGGSETVVATGSTAAAYTLGGLTDDVEYSVRVRAENSAGKGAWSDAVVQVAALPFAPDDLSGLQLWLDASDASTLYDATTGGSLVAADGGVARWEDKSGNDRHATQGTAGSRPARKTAIQGGLDVLRLDGSDDFMSIASSTATFKFLHSTQATVFFVAKIGVSSNPNAFYAILNTTVAATVNVGAWIAFDDRSSLPANNRMRVVVVNGNSGQLVANSGADDNATANVFLLGSFTLDNTAAVAGDRVAFRLNGGTAEENNSSTNTASIANSSGDLHIGKEATASSGYMSGDLAEILIYNSALGDTDREAVENYLIEKWGIT
jgi:hypothetical protein